MKGHFWQGLATMIGVMIGAGILAIPHAVSSTGFFLGSLLIIGIGICMLLLNLYLGEVVLRTQGDHQLYGLAQRYLGTAGRHAMLWAFLLGVIGALAAYIVGEAQVISTLFGIPAPAAAFAFLIAMGIILIRGPSLVQQSEIVLNAVKIALFLVIFALVANTDFSYSALAVFEPSNIFLPIGAILFSFLAFTAIPEVKEELRGNWHHMRKVLIVSATVTIAVYVLFAFLVIGATHGQVTEIATLALGNGFGNGVFILINCFALLTMGTAAIIHFATLQEMLVIDMRMRKELAFLIVMLVPAALALAFNDFSGIIGLTGALTGGVTGMLVLLMHQNARRMGDRKPEYTVADNRFAEVLLAVVFAAAMFVQVLQLF